MNIDNNWLIRLEREERRKSFKQIVFFAAAILASFCMGFYTCLAFFGGF